MGKRVKEKQRLKEIKKEAIKEGFNTDPSFQFAYVCDIKFLTDEEAQQALAYIYDMASGYGEVRLNQYLDYVRDGEAFIPSEIWYTSSLGWKKEDLEGITLSTADGLIFGLPPLRVFS